MTTGASQPSALPHHGLVLTAGLGTRLRPLSLVRAKPALPVAGEPLARRIVRHMVAHGVADVVLNLHYLPETVARAVGDGSDLGARVRYSWEHPTVLGSAGGPRWALDLIESDTFFIVNGDTLTDVDLGALAARHLETGADVTLALNENRDPQRYGGVVLGDDGIVTTFVRPRAAVSSFHFVGVQIVNARVFRDLPRGEPLNSVGGVYDAWMADHPGAVRGYVCNSSFWDVGTVDTYVATSHAFARDADVERGRRVRVAPDARVVRSILWDDVTIQAGAHLVDCVVTDGVTVPAGAHFTRTILRRGLNGGLLTDLMPDAHD